MSDPVVEEFEYEKLRQKGKKEGWWIDPPPSLEEQIADIKLEIFGAAVFIGTILLFIFG